MANIEPIIKVDSEGGVLAGSIYLFNDLVRLDEETVEFYSDDLNTVENSSDYLSKIFSTNKLLKSGVVKEILRYFFTTSISTRVSNSLRVNPHPIYNQVWYLNNIPKTFTNTKWESALQSVGSTPLQLVPVTDSTALTRIMSTAVILGFAAPPPELDKSRVVRRYVGSGTLQFEDLDEVVDTSYDDPTRYYTSQLLDLRNSITSTWTAIAANESSYGKEIDLNTAPLDGAAVKVLSGYSSQGSSNTVTVKVSYVSKTVNPVTDSLTSSHKSTTLTLRKTSLDSVTSEKLGVSIHWVGEGETGLLKITWDPSIIFDAKIQNVKLYTT